MNRCADPPLSLPFYLKMRNRRAARGVRGAWTEDTRWMEVTVQLHKFTADCNRVITKNVWYVYLNILKMLVT